MKRIKDFRDLKKGKTYRAVFDFTIAGFDHDGEIITEYPKSLHERFLCYDDIKEADVRIYEK